MTSNKVARTAHLLGNLVASKRCTCNESGFERIEVICPGLEGSYIRDNCIKCLFQLLLDAPNKEDTK